MMLLEMNTECFFSYQVTHLGTVPKACKEHFSGARVETGLSPELTL